MSTNSHRRRPWFGSGGLHAGAGVGRLGVADQISDGLPQRGRDRPRRPPSHHENGCQAAGRGPDGDRVVSPTSGGLTVTQPRRASPGWRFGWQLAAWAKHRQPPPDPGGIRPFVHSVRRILRRFGCRPLGFPMISGQVRFPPPPLFPVRAIDGHGWTNGV